MILFAASTLCPGDGRGPKSKKICTVWLPVPSADQGCHQCAAELFEIYLLWWSISYPANETILGTIVNVAFAYFPKVVTSEVGI